VYVGNPAANSVVRGGVIALDGAHRQNALARIHTLGRMHDVLIAPQFKPYYARAQGRDLGLTSGGTGLEDSGARLGWINYDAEFH